MFKFLDNAQYVAQQLQKSEAKLSPVTGVVGPAAPGTLAPRTRPVSLAQSAVSYTGGSLMNKTAQTNVIFTQPNFYSPLHTPQNWQTPSKRRECYQYCRHFVDNEPKVASALDFYCFEPSSQVLMADGTQKSISSTVAGEMVRSHDGSTNHIVRKFVRQAKETMLKIKIAGVSMGSLRCTPGHQILTDRNGIIDFIDAGELKKGDFVLTPCDYDDVEFPPIQTQYQKDLAWVLGAYAAEGCGIPYEHTDKKGITRESYKGVYFTLSYEERATFAEELRDRIHRLYGEKNVHISADQENGCTLVSVYGEGIADDMMGLCPGKSSDGSKRLAPSVLRWTNDSLLQVLAGFMSGDGCFNRSNGFQGVGVSKKLCEQMANICDRIGLEYSFTRTRMPEGRQTCYNLRISRRACDVLTGLTHKMQANRSVDESKIRNTPYFKKGKYIYREIRSVSSYQYEGEVYDLEIANSHSYVVNRIAVHNSHFPMNGFNVVHKKPQIRRYFEHINKKLRLPYWCKMISREYYTLGDVFPFSEIDCDQCHGTGYYKKDLCNHPGGSFRRLVVLNPDWIDVQTSVLAEDPVITLLPDDELKRLVWLKQPKALYDKLPDHIKKLIHAGRPIPLANEAVSHIRFNPYPYGVYGTSLLRRLFKVLMYKDKLMTAQWIVAERLILPIRVVKVGDNDRPASANDIADVQSQLAQVANDPNLTLVTHHAFDYDWIGTNGKVLQLSNEYDLINKEILQGLMLNEALLSGEMGAYASAAIGAEALIERMESWRMELSQWIVEKIYVPICQMKGFVNEEETAEIGEPQWDVPDIKWNDMHLRDETAPRQTWMQLHDKQVMSTQTLCKKMDLDYDHEVENIRYESSNGMGPGAQQQGGGGGGPGGPPGGGAGGGMEMGGSMPMGGPPGSASMGAPAGGAGLGAPAGGGAGGAPATAGVSPMGGSSGKVLSSGRKSANKPDEADVVPQNIKLTSIEINMHKLLEGMQMPFRKFIQPAIGKYKADFTIPELRLDIECDGGIWHENPEAQAHDKQRDAELATAGWTVLRFSEKELKENLDAVKNTLEAIVQKLWQRAWEKQKKQASTIETSDEIAITAGYMVTNRGTTLGPDAWGRLKRLGETNSTVKCAYIEEEPTLGSQAEETNDDSETSRDADQGQGNSMA